MIKDSTKNYIDAPKVGWILNENSELEIDFFSENPYPDSIANISIDDHEDEGKDDENTCVSSSDEEENDYEDSEDE